MGYEFKILRLLLEALQLLSEYPIETLLLLAGSFLLRLLWEAFCFVLRGTANTMLSYLLTKTVLKHLRPSDGYFSDDERPERRAEELARELGRRKESEEVLREQLKQERQRAERLEAELKLREDHRPWWHRFLG